LINLRDAGRWAITPYTAWNEIDIIRSSWVTVVLGLTASEEFARLILGTRQGREKLFLNMGLCLSGTRH
jgi:hypothetical protein